MEPETVGIRHEDERERDGEEDPEGEASVLRDGFHVRKIKEGEKNGDDDGNREAVREDHAADVVALLAEEGKAADRALRKDFIRPTSEHASLLAVWAAQAEGAAKGGANGRAACVLHLGQWSSNSVPRSLRSGIGMLLRVAHESLAVGELSQRQRQSRPPEGGRYKCKNKGNVNDKDNVRIKGAYPIK